MNILLSINGRLSLESSLEPQYHKRLGQALYFLKDYEGAVAAYEDAIHYEPDNSITKTYLEEAKIKADRQKEKQARSARGEEVSVLTENSSVQATVINSVATDPDAKAAVVTGTP